MLPDRAASSSLPPADLPLSFAAYQLETQRTAFYPAIGGHGELYPALGLANEVGEVLGKIKKIHRDKSGKYEESDLEAISAELGDVLWYVAQLAGELGLSMELSALGNLDKLRSRQLRGTLGGSGDQR
jgi:NTP pyrophosphatase (non-canonical NTP hydrolase)